VAAVTVASVRQWQWSRFPGKTDRTG